MTATRRAGLAGLMGLLAGGARAPAVAQAGEQWCETDPLVVITTPGGALVPVCVTNGAAGLEHLLLVQLAEMSYTAARVDGTKATLVKLLVTVPTGWGGQRFATSSVVSTGPFKTGMVLGAATGQSGKPMRIEFKLGTP